MNPTDEVSVKRILNVPKRGVGDTSVARVDAWMQGRGLSFLEGLRRADEAGVSGLATCSSMAIFRGSADFIRRHVGDRA